VGLDVRLVLAVLLACGLAVDVMAVETVALDAVDAVASSSPSTRSWPATGARSRWASRGSPSRWWW
jgi:hypothetical protein